MGARGNKNEDMPSCLHKAGGDPQTLLKITILLGEAQTSLNEDTQSAYFLLDKAMELLRQENANNHRVLSQPHTLSRWQTRHLNEYIHHHLEIPIRIYNLSALLGLSTSHFCHLFKNTFGITPRVYVARMRLTAARRMMLDTDQPLTNIAHAHGFCDQSHFCRTFRREIGISPQVWRQRRIHDVLPIS
ncbi:helix-turn-helix transcriptional regulator [Pseudomonas fluorescens]|jgi:AraC-like DNA-binding protein|uniref:HTH-type transcriptional activator RhaS n=1 Tax=Pseudomonas fluorescens TaxID=294 RepID=A0A5E7MQ24_PSEFL|nr:AraC family transcriptional regulator [Pseudomonas fluorescens]VVP26924.1 HTH-type transcriptional activator RhaS [Pseudomonas fluorescens]